MPDTRNIVGANSGNDVQLDNVVLAAYSQEILFQAQPAMRFESVCVRRTELSVMPGNTIKFLRYNALSGSSSINETDTIVTDTISTSLFDITVGENAKAVSMSELLLRSSVTDVLQDASVLLGQHYARSRDSQIRDALLSAPNVVYGGGKTTRADLVSTDLFDVDAVRWAVEVLATNKAPKIQGDAYVAFIHPHQARFLRKDPAWVNAQNYANPDNILSGEIGRIEDVRFIETTQIPIVKKATQDIWADNADTGSNTALPANNNTDVYRAVVVGDYAVGLADALPVEMRDDGVIDFGRTRKLAYYGIWGVGLIETGHAVIIETA